MVGFAHTAPRIRASVAFLHPVDAIHAVGENGSALLSIEFTRNSRWIAEMDCSGGQSQVKYLRMQQLSFFGSQVFWHLLAKMF
ncbi:hypothetical protein BSKO_02774 [Bryopsis sp. KO-2023]|nr:hypothetical protein BSKO_02774 [Bryopsis sp. KO-2023]